MTLVVKNYLFMLFLQSAFNFYCPFIDSCKEAIIEKHRHTGVFVQKPDLLMVGRDFVPSLLIDQFLIS